METDPITVEPVGSDVDVDVLVVGLHG